MNIHTRFAGVISLLIFSTQAQAQTADECMAEVRKVQAFIADKFNPDDDENEIATTHLEMAELDAGKGDGAKCMRSVESSEGGIWLSRVEVAPQVLPILQPDHT